MTHVHPGRVRAVTTAGLLMLGVLAGCGGDDAADTTSSSTVELDENGDKITIKDGESSLSVGDAELPDSFPDGDVPLPNGELTAVVSGEDAGDEFYSLSYVVEGGDAKSAAKQYKRALADDGYVIEESGAIVASEATFSAFTAVGTDWDVIVYGGGATNDKGALSLQVTPHDPKSPITG